MPKASSRIFANGARQLVVHDAQETTAVPGTYVFSLTPITNMGASGEGAVITTVLTPLTRWLEAAATEVNAPEASITVLAPASAHGISFGSLQLRVSVRCELRGAVRAERAFGVWPTERETDT